MQRMQTGNAKWWFDHPTMATGGITYQRMVDSAMVLLFDNTYSIISNGEVFQAAERLIDFDPDSSRSAIGFNRQQAEQMLYYANYPIDYLIINAQCEENLSALGWANLGTTRDLGKQWGQLWLNPFVMNREGRANGLPNNATGVEIMTFWIAAVFLHELMHVFQFSHGGRIDNTPTHPYNRTLPQVAYRSVIDVSGHSAGFFLTGGFNIMMGCGTSSSAILPYEDTEGEMLNQIEPPATISEYRTSAARESVLLSSLESKGSD